MKQGRPANRLIQSSSPYLIQHAYNPVDWYEWGEEALERAKREDKPILVSIGYSACHWCHVMERESFEQDDIAALMNEYFICIKIDREERPDLDHVYMEAVQAMGLQGGWPLNVFLTPDQSPFYGGTYFQPQRWSRILIELNRVFKERRSEINNSADDLRKHLNRIHSVENSEQGISLDLADRMFEKITQAYDAQFGGLDKAPKFIMPSIWRFLLRYAVGRPEHQATQMVHQTLIKIACGGIYDQIGGGFARYSVDERWFAPHFEKMLYDNGQLLSLYSEAWLATKDPVFKSVVEETINWLIKEMSHPSGGFYSALDADSEGEEGKFYCWTEEELKKILGDDYKPASDYYQTTSSGNWEHGQNILLGQSSNQRPSNLNQWKNQLLQQRDKKIRPGLDDKIITSWNALTIVGLVDAALAFNQRDWLGLAKKADQFLKKELLINGTLRRSFRERTGSTEAFLDDYAEFIHAQWSLYEATFDSQYIDSAIHWTNYVIEHFSNHSDVFFAYTSKNAESLITRTIEWYDNVIPSSNSTMCQVLLKGAAHTGKREWMNRAEKMISLRAAFMEASPAYHCGWGIALLDFVRGYDEVVILGPQANQYRFDFATVFKPFSIYTGASEEISDTQQQLPHFDGRPLNNVSTIIYVCRNQTCQLPVKTVLEALSLLTAV